MRWPRFEGSFSKHLRHFRRRKSPEPRLTSWPASAFQSNWNRWKCRFSRSIWTRSMARRRASASIVPQEPTCAGSPTTSASGWAAARSLNPCGAPTPAISTRSTPTRSKNWRILPQPAGCAEALIPAAKLLPQFTSATVDVLTAGQIRQGKDFRLSPFLSKPLSKYVKAISQEGDLVAIGEARLPLLYHPILVL